MSDYGRISKSIVKAIADALRFCNGNEAQYTPGQMPNAVRLLKKRLMQKTITRNGVYIPPSNYDGFDRVTVNVEGGGGDAVLVSKNITANGNYSPVDDNADGYSSVSVAVPGAVLQTKTATANGTVTPDTGYDGMSSVEVAVPNTYSAADNGKVVSGGQLVAQTARAAAITQNGTYDTTENNSVTVNVSGGGGGLSASVGELFRHIMFSNSANDGVSRSNRYFYRNTNEPVLFLCGAYYSDGTIAYTGYAAVSFSSSGVTGTYSSYGDLTGVVEKTTPSGTTYYVQIMNGMFPTSTDYNLVKYRYSGLSDSNLFNYVFDSSSIFVNGGDKEFNGSQTLIDSMYSMIDAMYQEYYAS